MPPKPKYTRDQVAAAAFEIIRQDGLSALTARELGKRLGTSASPIFTVFSGMEEVKLAARELAMEEFRQYVGDYTQYTPAFKRIGVMLVSYGLHRPEQFKLLFMQEHKGAQDLRDSIRDMGILSDVCIDLICRDYDLSRPEAEILFEQMWTQAFGLGAMCALRVCSLTEEEIGRRLSMVFAGTITLIRSGKLDQVYANVEALSDGTFHGRPIRDLPF